MEFSIAILVICLATLALSGVTGFVSIGLIINSTKKKAKYAKKVKLESQIKDYTDMLGKTNDAVSKMMLQKQINDLQDELKSIK